MLKCLHTTCLSIVLLLSGQMLLAAPLAMVTDLNGEPQAKGQPLALLAELDEGAEIELAPEARLTLVYYASGEEFKAQGPLKLVLKTAAPEGNGQPLQGQALMAAADSTRLATADHSQAAVIMRSATAPTESALILQYPAWSTILEPKPIFSWKAPGGNDKAYSYRLELLDHKGKVLFSGQSDIGRMRLPKDLELPKGERLTWELEAKRGKEMLFGRADFQIADDTTLAKLDQMSAQLNSNFGHRLVFFRYLKANGFKHSADELWQSLVTERPELGAKPQGATH
jgi:hypothetical protein